ncbi:MAG: radical SAM family heme chaperone HemW [Rikenellaceae bacterium]
MALLYLHIPFCRSICGYCDFFKSGRVEQLSAMVAATMTEIESERDFLSTRRLETIYFGGGTPSLLSVEQVGAFMERIARCYDVSGVSEVTLEANPDDLTDEYLRGLRSVGVNRLSIGVQSFDDELLRFMNRRHSASQSIEAIEHARSVGFDNIAIDLIFGVDGYTSRSLVGSLQQTVDLGVEHVAAYHLTIEERTMFARRVQRGEFSAVAEEVSEREYEQVRVALESGGYEHYEISNYARSGYRSRHNSAYWRGVEYLGVGAGAHSYARGVRRWSGGSMDRYLQGGDARYESEVLSEQQMRNEMVMTSLRCCEGLDLVAFESRFGVGERARLLADVERFVAVGWVVVSGDRVAIVREHFLQSDMIIESLFVV